MDKYLKQKIIPRHNIFKPQKIKGKDKNLTEARRKNYLQREKIRIISEFSEIMQGKKRME